MAEPIVALVLDTFQQFLEEEELHAGLYAHGKLKLELERIKKLLEGIRSRQQEEEVREWEGEIKNLAYKAEDVLEKYVIKATIKRRSSGIKKVWSGFASILSDSLSLRKVAKELIMIKTQIADLRRSVPPNTVNPVPDDDKRTSADLENFHFVGMDDSISELVSILMDENKKHIISLYGMAGSGKTTLVKMVFNHPIIKKYFDCFAFVRVTQICQTTQVLKDLLNQLINTTTTSQGNTYAELVPAISKVFLENKCLVVLDDIWNTKDRDIICRAFVNSNGKSKVLLTTRIEDMGNVGLIYHHRLLNEKEGLELLQKVSLIKLENTDSGIGKSFEHLAKEMVHKCGGVPLAISILGEILKSKSSLKEWKMINKDIGSTLNRGSGEAAAKVLGLSYHDLPPHLKPCFLYMGIFGKERNIEPRKLYHLWIAEGIISTEKCRGNETLMDVAERFLRELSSRCMAQLEIDLALGRLKSCRLYDLMRGYSLRKAKEEEFFESIDMDLRGGQSVGVDTSIADNARRLAIHMNIDARDTRCVKPFEQITSKFIRALLFRCVKPSQHPSVSSDLPIFSMGRYTIEESVGAKFKFLRVLDFEDCRFHCKKLPSGIGKLVLLRYLSIRGSYVEELPLSVGDLPLLQTLDIRTSNTIQIHADIFLKMKHLRHLYLSYFKCGSRGKLQLNGLIHLETLIFEVDIYTLNVSGLSHLTNIRYFRVNMLWNHSEWVSIITDMQSWRKVKRLEVGIFMVEGETLTKVFENNNITDLRLCHISSFIVVPARASRSNLVSLEIISCKDVDDTMMELLSKFPNLRKLRCSANVASVKEINFSEKPFPQLRSLELYDLVDLEKLEVAEGNLPNLIKLRVGGCENLVIEPEDGLRNLHTLRELEVDMNNMSKFKEMCRKYHSHYAHVLINEF